MRLLFKPRAVDDMAGIAVYSLREWGEDQARDYMDGLELACRDRARHFQLGREVDGFRRWRYERHLIYYVVDAGGSAREQNTDGTDLVIVRILHEKMLPARHL
jgi:plasmid stabilization system protein ParE